MYGKTPDDYMREMMELYRRSHKTPEPLPEPVHTPEREPLPPEPVPEPMPEPMPEPAPEPMPEFRSLSVQTPVPEAQYDDLPQSLPLPEIPSAPPVQMMNYEFAEESRPADNSPAETSFGWIQVTARTAGNALPLEGVSVLIYRENGTENELVSSLVTDISGSTERVKLPAPPVTNTRSQAYSTYQIKAFLPGYTRMESVSVPVFSNTTSLQAFELIPLPTGTDGDGPVIINNNTEPKY